MRVSHTDSSANTRRLRAAGVAFCAAISAALVICALGCDGARPGGKVPEIGAGSTWRWRAASMKVSGLTTPFPALRGAPAAIDVRIAFFDTEDDETKAVGSLTVLISGAGIELARTEISLTDEHRHHEHWDPVTETYSVRITLAGKAEPQPGQSLEVRALFEGEDGSLMKAGRDMKWPRIETVTPPGTAQ